MGAVEAGPACRRAGIVKLTLARWARLTVDKQISAEEPASPGLERATDPRSCLEHMETSDRPHRELTRRAATIEKHEGGRSLGGNP